MTEEQSKALDDIISKLSEIQVKLMSVGIPSEDYNDISETIGNIKERLANIESIAQTVKKTVEITQTELRGLILWATVGIEKSRWGSYFSTVDFIKKNCGIMSGNKTRYKNLTFNSNLENL